MLATSASRKYLLVRHSGRRRGHRLLSKHRRRHRPSSQSVGHHRITAQHFLLVKLRYLHTKKTSEFTECKLSDVFGTPQAFLSAKKASEFTICKLSDVFGHAMHLLGSQEYIGFQKMQAFRCIWLYKKISFHTKNIGKT